MKTLGSALFRLPQYFLINLVKAYRLLFSPWLGSTCRFEPTCSAYGLQALGQHGAVVGTGLTVYRLARCQPWCQGGHDPVPTTHLFSRLVAAGATSPLSSEKNPS